MNDLGKVQRGPHWNDNLENRLWSTLQLTQALLSSDLPTHLAHYTTAAGARGILSSSQLYASDPRYLNDLDELRHVTSLLEERWRAFRRAYVLTDDDRMPGILDCIETGLVEDGETAFTDTARIYVTSFADATPGSDEPSHLTGDDRLSQWRGYGGDKGPAYALTFDGPSLAVLLARRVDAGSEASPIDATDRYADVRLLKVVYSRQEQSRILDEVLTDGLTHIINDALEGPPQHHAEDGPGRRPFIDSQELRTLNACATLRSILLLCAVTFKNSGFEEEQEWRLVVTDVAKSRRIPHYREGSIGLIPYRLVGPPPTPQPPAGNHVVFYPDQLPPRVEYHRRFGVGLPLLRVVQGPGTPVPELGQQAMADVLEQNHYGKDVDVLLSSISYRRN